MEFLLVWPIISLIGFLCCAFMDHAPKLRSEEGVILLLWPLAIIALLFVWILAKVVPDEDFFPL